MPNKNFQELDIKAGIANGGHVGAVFIVCRPDNVGGGWVLYLRTSWTRGFRPLRSARNETNRVFRDLRRLVLLVRNEFRYSTEISLFNAGDPALARFTMLLPADRGDLGIPTGQPTDPAASGEQDPH